MRFAPASYRHCVVTGASSGIGWAFAEGLAPRARLLTLAARRRERLEQLAAELRARHAVECRIVVVDLAVPAGPEQLLAALREPGMPPVDLLVNNAGFGRHGGYGEFPWADFERMIQLNATTCAALIRGLWDELAAAPGRGVINVASTAGFQPIPHFVVYAATKAFLRSLSLGLAGEARRRGVRVLAVSPGPVPTEFGRIAGSRLRVAKARIPAERVVRAALAAYERGKLEVVPGWLNKVMAVASRAPASWVVPVSAVVAGQVVRKDSPAAASTAAPRDADR
ncbi:MAG: SDR family NAD(P)-dependent oxidoreductase [Acidobacteria bacterium]|nr:SDR family NAD(P)-dependent oxidoreductase [Acidobacteriota bacterium]